jgi:peroxiredoxin
MKQKARLTFLTTVLLTSAFALPSGSVPRRSPEFAIAEPGGQTILLSNLRGKVVVLEFLFIKSEHCMRVLKTLDKLNSELGPRGFQAAGIVFDPPNTPNNDGPLIAATTSYFKLTLPVGQTSKNSVDSYLGRTGNEVLNIPQVVVIDRAGMIRATSGGRGGNPALEDENSLRNLIDSLLKEGGSGQSNRK